MDKLIQFATKAIIIKDGRLLALYVDRPDGMRLWDLPGGRIEFGEEPEEGLIREVQEELSSQVEIIELIDTWNHLPNESWQIVGVFYLCKLTSGDIKISNEHSGFQWIDINKIKEEFTAQVFLQKMLTWDWKELVSKVEVD